MNVEFVDAPERDVLRALLRTDAGLSGRALARVTGLTQSSAQRALVRLRERGLVLADEAPPALLYRVNRDHVAIPALLELLSLPERIRERAAELIRPWKVQPVSAVLYGSVARRHAGPGSDVDMLVVRPSQTRPDDPVWEDQVAALSDALRRWTGLTPSVLELTPAQVRRGLAGREPYLVDAADGGLLVIGRTLRDIGRRVG